MALDLRSSEMDHGIMEALFSYSTDLSHLIFGAFLGRSFWELRSALSSCGTQAGHMTLGCQGILY